jgi:hypothetical protein
MKIITYPSLLKKKARIFANFNRADLIVIGVSFMTLSYFRFNGLISLSLMLVILFLFKVVSSCIPRGFFLGIRGDRYLKWHQSLEDIYEK